MISSPLGYSPIAGARYYGIGNEFMGVLIGAALVGGTLCADWFLQTKIKTARRWAVAAVIILLFLVFFSLASPNHGANFGGSLTALIAFSYTVARLLWPKRYRQSILWMLSGGAVLFLALIFIDVLSLAERQSHVARAISTINEGGITTVIEIVSRKLAMNIRLIRYTNWSHLLFSTLAVYIFLLFWPRGLLKKILERRPVIAAGLAGCAIASIVALLANDSGVVAAAAMIVFAIAVLVDLVIAELIAGRNAI